MTVTEPGQTAHPMCDPEGVRPEQPGGSTEGK
jgi:hypothetical protein